MRHSKFVRPNSFQLRFFRCPECGAVMTAPKRGGMVNEKLHIKNMYCYVCKDERQFVMEDHEQMRC